MHLAYTRALSRSDALLARVVLVRIVADWRVVLVRKPPGCAAFESKMALALDCAVLCDAARPTSSRPTRRLDLGGGPGSSF